MQIELIQQCLADNRKAQERFYKECYTRFIGTAYRYSKNKEEAVYYFNLGFVKILLNLSTYNASFPFNAWAKKVLINAILNEIKKEQAHKSKLDSSVDLNLLNYSEKTEESEGQEKMELIEDKIKQLPPMTKRVFMLYVNEGYKHREIAEILEINETTSMWHFSDAKKRIRKMLNLN